MQLCMYVYRTSIISYTTFPTVYFCILVGLEYNYKYSMILVQYWSVCNYNDPTRMCKYDDYN